MNNRGFTLIELMASIVILAVIFSVAVKRYIEVHDMANTTAAIEMCTDLNSREIAVWAGTLLTGNYQTDNDVFQQRYLDDLRWASLTQTGGTILVGGQRIGLRRTPSSYEFSARWVYDSTL